LAENIFKCTLKSLNFSDPDYAGITFTEDQQTRLAAAFPSGVCDWSKPGVGQVASAGGTTYKAGPGGQPFGDEPGSGLGTSLLTALNSAKLWVGIKNSDDVGTFFDVRADVYKNGDPNPIGGGQLNRTAAASSGFNNAKLNTIPLTLSAGPHEVPSGTVLKVKVSARITCTGPTHATAPSGYGSTTRRRAATSTPRSTGWSEDYFLRSGSVLGATQGAGPKTTIDVALNSKEKCGGRSLTDVGSWTITLP
jgi:hypothetical protein